MNLYCVEAKIVCSHDDETPLIALEWVLSGIVDSYCPELSPKSLDSVEYETINPELVSAQVTATLLLYIAADDPVEAGEVAATVVKDLRNTWLNLVNVSVDSVDRITNEEDILPSWRKSIPFSKDDDANIVCRDYCV